jgi:hypothetical protein
MPYALRHINEPHLESWAVSGSEGPQSGGGGILRGFSRNLGFPQRIRHDVGLLPVKKVLEYRNAGDYSSEYDSPPIGRRWLLAVGLGVAGIIYADRNAWWRRILYVLFFSVLLCFP